MTRLKYSFFLNYCQFARQHYDEPGGNWINHLNGHKPAALADPSTL